jgi:hypothetical protein
MVRLSRYFLVIIAIVAFSVALPKLYWMAFEKPTRVPLVLYSCVKHDFIISRNESGKTVWKDTKGNVYSRNQYDESLPLFYTTQLMNSGTMPDTINGVAIDIHEVNMARNNIRIKPADILMPNPELYPLFEAESGRVNLEMPKDFFRIAWRMEFIDAKTNKVDEEKSRMFSAVLYKNGFKFPAKSINGLPTTRKSCDEGYFVVDSADQLFQVKLIKGKPFVKKINIPDGLTFKYITCVDFKDRRFYAYLFSADNHLYILTQDDYELVKFPIEGIDPTQCEVKIYGDFFNYNIVTTGDDFTRVDALNSEDFKFVDKYYESWPTADKKSEGKIAGFLFPFQISMSDPKSEYVSFYAGLSKTYSWLIFSLVLLVAQFFITKRRKAKSGKQVADLVIIAVTGIFGFLAVNIFPNKFYD